MHGSFGRCAPSPRDLNVIGEDFQAQDGDVQESNLIIITGQEGVGKSTIWKALLAVTPSAASFDAENVGQTNPWEMNEQFIRLLWKNVIDLIRNFRDAGFQTIIAGSFLTTYTEYKEFRRLFPDKMTVYVVHLCAEKAVRDRRRIERSKPTDKEDRDDIDRRYPEDCSLMQAGDDYRYIRVDNSALSVAETVHAIQQAIPEVFQP